MVTYALVETSIHDTLTSQKMAFDRLVGTNSHPHAGAVFGYYPTFDEGSDPSYVRIHRTHS